MKKLAMILCVLLCFSSQALAQDRIGFFERIFGSTEEADSDPGGYLEKLLEENLSGEGRDVEITGFSGALSGRATLETLTISDADGAWLSIEDAVLDWNRAALLRGSLDVTELSAKRIEYPRSAAPSEEAGITPEASGFQLPDLPVSVKIEKILAERIEIGSAVFGAETIASLSGSLNLANGAGSANLTAQRLNSDGLLALATSFDNESRLLDIDLELDEAEEGVVANLLDLPGRPPVRLTISGSAPVDAFSAEVQLLTDEVLRLSGQVRTEKPEAVDGGIARLHANLGGNVSPIFRDEYRPFFGERVDLDLVATTFADGRFVLDEFQAQTETLDLAARVEVGKNGLPELIDVDGTVSSAVGQAVPLPLSGPKTTVDRIELSVNFDASLDDQWTGVFGIKGLGRPGFSADELDLTAIGRIESLPTKNVTGAITFSAANLDLSDPDTDAALGENVTGGLNLSWAENEVLALRDLRVDGESYSFDANMDLFLTQEGPTTKGSASVSIDDASAFSGVAQRQISGFAKLETEYELAPLAGFFEVSILGETRGLSVSQKELDGILNGSVALKAQAKRDQSGISLFVDSLKSENADLQGRAVLRSEGSTVLLAAKLADAALLLPDVNGTINLDFNAIQDGTVWGWETKVALPGSQLDASGTAINVLQDQIISAAGDLKVSNLGDFSQVVGRKLGGSISTRFSSEYSAQQNRISVNLDGSSTNLLIDQPQADALMAGTVAHVIDLAKAGEVLTLRRSNLTGPEIDLFLDGTLSATAGSFQAKATIANAANLAPKAPPLPIAFETEARRDGDDWNINAGVQSDFFSALIDGKLLDPVGATPGYTGSIKANAQDISLLEPLIERPITGSLNLAAKGQLNLDGSKIIAEAELSGQGLGVGQPEIDSLLRGTVEANIVAKRENMSLDIEAFEVTSDLLKLFAEGAIGPENNLIEFAAQLIDVSPIAPGFSGPAKIEGTVSRERESLLNLKLDAVGPGGATAEVMGTAAEDGSAVDLAINGIAPLGLINRFILPRSLSGAARFNLNIKGPPSFENVSGQVSANGARLVAPETGVNFDNIDASAQLSSGRASVSVETQVSTGGRIELSGQIGLSPPFTSAIAVDLVRLGLTDPRLFQTTLNGRLQVNGPLVGRAAISGALAMGETDIRIPSTGLGGAGEIPEIVHLNEPPPVRGTRRRAGLLEQSQNNRTGTGTGYPLDISVSAPNQIFVRGRGLDSEFGGNLKITGDTNNVVPVGAFDLIRGRLDILGNRLQLEEATISLQGSFIPVIRMIATTRAEDVAVAVGLSGPATNPEISFTSEPDLPEEEVLARLLFGRGLETLSPIQAAQLALAVRTLAGRGGEGVVGSIRRKSGLADLDISTDEDGNAAVRAGAYLSENVYTDVTVGSDGETELNLNLDLTPSVTLKGSTANSGESSIGVFFERDY